MLIHGGNIYILHMVRRYLRRQYDSLTVLYIGTGRDCIPIWRCVLVR